MFFIFGVLVDVYRHMWADESKMKKLGMIFYALMVLGWIFHISALLNYHNKVFRYADDLHIGKVFCRQ